jgi:hypothetical protein
MKFLYGVLFVSLIFAATNLQAQDKPDAGREKILYGQKGIIELFGGLSLSGGSDDFSTVSFSAEPGLNYFVIDNLYLGAHFKIGITRRKVRENYFFYNYNSHYKTVVNLGLGIPLGYIKKISDHVYFNLEAPEFSFYLIDLKHFRVYPNVITAFKFPFDSSVIEIGIRHNFFYLTERSMSDVYYSYNVFLGFSACFNTVKSDKPAPVKNIIDTQKKG